jgi:hypothetical protein
LSPAGDQDAYELSDQDKDCNQVQDEHAQAGDADAHPSKRTRAIDGFNQGGRRQDGKHRRGCVGTSLHRELHEQGI